MWKRVARWTAGIALGALAVVTIVSAFEKKEPVFKSEVAPGPSIAGMSKSEWYYRGTAIASDPSIVKTASGLEMFYTDLDTSKNRTVIARASSADGTNWQAADGNGGVNGLVIAGRDGEWDQNVESASIVKQDAGWMLFFSGYRDEGQPFRGFPAAIWAAKSADGRAFTRISSDPVMIPTRGWYDNDALYSPTILYENGVFHMVYVGHAYTDFSNVGGGGVFLLSAISKDGTTWVKSEEPVAKPGQFGSWMSEGVAEPYLVRRAPGSYLLFFTGLEGENRAIGVAKAASPDGPWTFGSNPIVKPGAPGAPDEHQVLAPAVLIEGDQIRLWYLAADKKEALSIGQVSGPLDQVLAGAGL